MAFPDPVTTGIVALAGSHVLKDSATRLLGPTAAYFGEELKAWAEAKVKRYRRIASSAERKAGKRLAEAGAVNARVFKKIIDDGCLCNDGLSAEYYGGFLASSRTEDGIDDANVPFVSAINRLSSDQLHGHWILYSILFNTVHGIPRNPYVRDHRKEAALYIPWETFMFLFDELRANHIEDEYIKFAFSGSGQQHQVTISDGLMYHFDWSNFSTRRLDPVFWGLLSENLVEHLYWGETGWDLAKQLNKDFPNDPLGIAPKEEFDEKEIEIMTKGGTVRYSTSADQGGVVFQPSILGMDLFLRAQGLAPVGRIGFDSLKYDFRPEHFADDILKKVRLVVPLKPRFPTPPKRRRKPTKR